MKNVVFVHGKNLQSMIRRTFFCCSHQNNRAIFFRRLRFPIMYLPNIQRRILNEQFSARNLPGNYRYWLGRKAVQLSSHLCNAVTRSLDNITTGNYKWCRMLLFFLLLSLYFFQCFWCNCRSWLALSDKTNAWIIFPRITYTLRGIFFALRSGTEDDIRSEGLSLFSFWEKEKQRLLKRAWKH